MLNDKKNKAIFFLGVRNAEEETGLTISSSSWLKSSLMSTVWHYFFKASLFLINAVQYCELPAIKSSKGDTFFLNLVS